MKTSHFRESFFSKFSVFGAIVIALNFCTSCTKDEKESNPLNENTQQPPNGIIYDGGNYQLSKGFLMDFGRITLVCPLDTAPTIFSYEFRLNLGSEKIDSHPDSLTQNDTVIYFYASIYSPTNGRLEPGLYTVDSEHSLLPNTISYGAFEIITFGPNGERIVDRANFETGSILIDFSNGRYGFTFDLVDGDGLEIKGYYQNRVPIIPGRVTQDEDPIPAPENFFQMEFY